MQKIIIQTKPGMRKVIVVGRIYKAPDFSIEDGLLEARFKIVPDDKNIFSAFNVRLAGAQVEYLKAYWQPNRLFLVEGELINIIRTLPSHEKLTMSEIKALNIELYQGTLSQKKEDKKESEV